MPMRITYMTSTHRIVYRFLIMMIALHNKAFSAFHNSPKAGNTQVMQKKETQ